MCVRYVIVSKYWGIERAFRAEFNFKFEPVYNAYPGGYWPVILSEDENTITRAKWGLVPHWTKRPIDNINCNANAAEVIKHPVYRIPIRKRRCLVLANCFYYWVRHEQARVPHLVYLKDQRLMSFAGIWDEWKDQNSDEKIRSFSIVTCRVNKRLSKHLKTMPVIIPPSGRRKYLNLNKPLNEIMRMLKPFESDQFNLYPVSPKIEDQLQNCRDLVMPVGDRVFPEYNYMPKVFLKLEGMGSTKSRKDRE